MDKNAYAVEFKNKLEQSERFTVFQRNEQRFDVESEDCRISFVYDRYADEDDGYVYSVSNPKTNDKNMSVNLLRFLRGARDVLSNSDSPENVAAVFNTYFVDVSNGDFSIRDEYDKMRKPFFVLALEIFNMLENDPIKIKWKNYDISWVEDLKERKRLRQLEQF